MGQGRHTLRSISDSVYPKWGGDGTKTHCVGRGGVRSLSPCHSQLSDWILRLQATFGASEFSADRWRQFRSVDMYTELCDWLKTGRLDVVCSLCAKFSDVLSETLLVHLDATLALLPDEVVLSDLCAWLVRAIIPLVLESQDLDVINILAEWVERRASDMEVTAKQTWPVNAIQLCELLQTDAGGTLFKNVTAKESARRIVGLAVPRTGLDEARQSQNALVRVHMLRNDLQQIVELRDRYNCSLSLAEYRSETVQSLAYRLLDRVVAVPLISAAISDVIRPYATQNCLQLDELLSSYVEELVHQHGSGGMRSSTLWESKAVEILVSISNRALCEQTLMSILSAAQFPWTDDVSNAVKTALDKNPSHAGLKGQCRLASLKQILIGYNLHGFNFAETTRSEDLAFYILTQDRDTAVEDALSVTQVYSNVSKEKVYLFRCCFLAERNRADEIVDLLRGIACQTLLDSICENFVRRCGRNLSNPLNKFHSQYATAARHVCRLLPLLTPECSQNLKDQLSDLEAVYRLESEFGKSISVNDYCSTAKRSQFCEKCLSSFEDDSSTNTAVSMTSKGDRDAKPGSKMSRLACLLKMPRYNEVFQAMRAARDGNIGHAVELAECILQRTADNPVDVVKHVLRILEALCESIQKGCVVTEAEVRLIHRMACNLALAAPASALQQSTCIVRSTRLALEMIAQCSIENSSFPDGRHRVDFDEQWIFGDYLSDVDYGGVIMDPKLAMSQAFAFVSAPLPSGDRAVQSCVPVLRQVEDITGNLVQLLTANEQTRLLLGYFLEAAALVDGAVEVDDVHRAVLATLKRCVFRRRADYPLALTAVCSLPHNLAIEYLRKLAKSAGIQYKKALAVAQVGLAYAQLTHSSAAKSLAQRCLTEAQWGYRLAKVQISFHDCFRAGTGDKWLLIPMLAANKCISVADVVEYCHDFQLNVNDSLCLYLTCLLLPSSDSTTVVSSVPYDVVRQRAEEACQHINPTFLITTLEKIFEKTSPYDYERLEFVLDNLQHTLPSSEQVNRSLEMSTVERDKNLLVCLKSYRRVSRPTEDEILSDESVRDRLPFHMLTMKEQRWRIITAELNADTVEPWIPMAALLRLPADHVYTTAIRNIVQSHVNQLPSTAQWSERSIDTDFMDTVHRLLSRVTNLELAVACVSWLANELPPGAEKVVAYTWCVNLLERHVASCSTEQRTHVSRVLEKHRTCLRMTSIEQVCFY